jgi:hypothetical protein
METDRQPERDAVAGRLQHLDQVLGMARPIRGSRAGRPCCRGLVT